jgi:hypothetical protein
MGNKIPQPTGVLISRLQRIARWLDSGQAGSAFDSEQQKTANRARANTCWQAAARLEDMLGKAEGQ